MYSLGRRSSSADLPRRGGNVGLPPCGTIFEGELEHGYSKAAVGQTQGCPRCGAPTQQQYANFVYATDVRTRVKLAPAGFFCSQCPTVIIDEAVVAAGVKPGLEFQGVVGLDFDGELRLFRTWNGKKPTYILDEKEQIIGLSTSSLMADLPGDVSAGAPRAKDGKQLKRKRHLAKLARRRNRRR